MKKVSIILLNYNNEADTNKCLDSLTKLNYPDFQVIVVNNGSTAESGKRLREHVIKLKSKIKIKVVEVKDNLGFAGGCNTGTKSANTDLVVLLNNDTIVDKNYLKEMIKLLESNEKIAIVGSRIKNVGQFYKKSETLGNVLSLTGDPIAVKSKDPTFTFMVSGCSLLFRKSVIGIPFDEDYLMYGEDTYASWLAKLRGYDLKIAPNSKLLHLGGQIRKRTPDLAEFHGEKNKIMNLLLFFEPITLIKISPIVLLNILLTLLVSTFKGRVHVRLRSYWWLIRNFGKIITKRRQIQIQRKVRDRNLAPYLTCKIPHHIGLLSDIINAFLWTYCFIVRLPVREIYGGD